MSQSSSRLTLPFIQAAQAQKHVTHNEALERLDFLTQLTVQAFEATTPPATATEGDIWALGTGAQGAWSGHDGALAGWYNSGWLFITPATGWRAAQGTQLRIWTGSTWEITGVLDVQNIAGVGINTASDAINRLSVAAGATLLSHEGAGHQLKLNKAAAADTASLLYQTGFSGRAEMGTAGADDFTIKVSADGVAWADSLVARGADGRVVLPAGAHVSDGSAGAPALAFDSDPDTGLWRAGADAVGVATGGAERVRVTNAGMTVSGVLGGTAVTQTRDDQTTGRLLKTGDFGLGQSITLTAGDDLNALSATGFYYNPTGGNCAGNNYPLVSAGALLNQRLTHTTWVQQFVSYGGGTSTAERLRQYSRSFGAVGWTPWVEIMHQGIIVGAVSQSGGVPTGGVIERGANANGSYVRFADGTQICTLNRTVSMAISAAHMGGFQSMTQPWVFPAQFGGTTPPCVMGSALQGTAFGVVFQSTTSTSQTGWNVTAITTQGAANRIVSLQATGRWF